MRRDFTAFTGGPGVVALLEVTDCYINDVRYLEDHLQRELSRARAAGRVECALSGSTAAAARIEVRRGTNLAKIWIEEAAPVGP